MKLLPDQQTRAVALMKNLSLFAGVQESALQAIALQMTWMKAAKNKVIIMEQEISTTLYVLASGSVGIWRRKGGDKLTVATLKAPDFFGEASMFSESPANALVKAAEESELFTLTRRDFDTLAASDVALGLLIEKNLEGIQSARAKKGDDSPSTQSTTPA